MKNKIVSNGSETVEEWEEVLDINKKAAELRRMLEQSIIKCPTCNRTKSNMAYLPYHKTWFCLECFERLKEHLAKKQ